MTADGRSIEDSVTNMRPRLRAGWAFGLAMLSVVSTAFADANQNRVRQLDTQAMQAYAELEIDRANQLLEQARQLAERSGIHGNDLARIHLHLGIVAIGGSQDRAAGLEAFRRALAEDPSIELERENRTPEIVTTPLTRSRRPSDSMTRSAASCWNSERFGWFSRAQRMACRYS